MKLTLQYSHHSHDESEVIDDPSATKAIELFDSFNWDSESNKANELKKCSPTLMVELSANNFIWVSSYSEDGIIKFVSNCKFPGIVKAWFGFSEKEGIVDLDSNELTPINARKALEYFLNGSHEELRCVY